MVRDLATPSPGESTSPDVRELESHRQQPFLLPVKPFFLHAARRVLGAGGRVEKSVMGMEERGVEVTILSSPLPPFCFTREGSCFGQGDAGVGH